LKFHEIIEDYCKEGNKRIVLISQITPENEELFVLGFAAIEYHHET